MTLAFGCDRSFYSACNNPLTITDRFMNLSQLQLDRYKSPGKPVTIFQPLQISCILKCVNTG